MNAETSNAEAARWENSDLPAHQLAKTMTDADIPRAKLKPRSEWESSDLPAYQLARTMIDASPDKGKLSRDNAVIYEAADYDDGIQVIVSGGEIDGKSDEELESMHISQIRVFRNGEMHGEIRNLDPGDSSDSFMSKFLTMVSEGDIGDSRTPFWKWFYKTAALLDSRGPGPYGYGPYPAFQGA